MNWTLQRRKDLKSGKIKGGFAGAPCDKALSYPIAGPSDVRDAWRLSGHSCDPKRVRSNIERIAKKYGWDSALPKQPVKMLSGDRFGSYAFLWGNKNQRDVAKEWFTPRTSGLLEIFNAIGKIPVVYHHASTDKLRGDVVGVIDKVKMDDYGLWAEGELRKGLQYKQILKNMIKQKGLYFSSGALPLSKRVSKSDGMISQWVWAELSLTPTPAEPRMMDVPVQLLEEAYSKSMGINAANTVKSIITKYGAEKAFGDGDEIELLPDYNKPMISTKTGVNNIMPTVKQLYEQRVAEATELEAMGDIEAAVALRNQAQGIKEATEFSVDDETPPIKGVNMSTEDMDGFSDLLRPPMALYDSQRFEKEQEEGSSPAVKAFYYNRIGGEDQEDAAVKAFYKGVFGPGYMDAVVKQERAFAKYVRFGERRLNRDEEAILNTQIFPSEHVKSLILSGMEAPAIKATMVEAQGSLGGFAVPPTVQRDILARMPGYTIVRNGGARVITLQNGNSVEVPEYTGGNDVYRGKLRGAWGSEASTPTQKDVSWGFKQLFANIYTYRMTLSRTLVEDSQNIVAFLADEMTQVLALDEDNEFLVGDGIGKPLGILPGGENTNGFKEINSGDASAITDDGVRKMKRSLAKQYRNTARWIANSDTYGEIERLKDTTGRTLYPDLTTTDILLSKPTSETEFMPDIAAGAYPLIFANLRAYWIVEKFGLTIERYQDSGTGINAVEFHVRRRVGGAPVEPWYFSVMKVAA